MLYNWNTINSEQYCRLITLGEDPKAEDLVWAMTGKTKNQMTVKDLKKFKLGNLTPELDPVTLKTFTTNGTTYAMQDMSDLPFGLFVDLAKEGEDLKSNLLTVMSYLYRPVTGLTKWNRLKLMLVITLAPRVKGKWLLKIIYKLLNSVHFQIEEYDPLKCDLRIKDMKQAPASAAHNVASFFLILSKELQQTTRKSLIKMMVEMQNQMTQNLTSIKDKQKQT